MELNLKSPVQMKIMSNKTLSKEQREGLFRVLKACFEKNMNCHQGLEWAKVQARLESNAEKLWSLNEWKELAANRMLLVMIKRRANTFFMIVQRKALKAAEVFTMTVRHWERRKEHKPKATAIDMAGAMGIELLTEEQYRELQKLGNFDTKTSSWVNTPSDIRKLGGALFCDRRYNTVFVYHGIPLQRRYLWQGKM